MQFNVSWNPFGDEATNNSKKYSGFYHCFCFALFCLVVYDFYGKKKVSIDLSENVSDDYNLVMIAFFISLFPSTLVEGVSCFKKNEGDSNVLKSPLEFNDLI